MLSEDAEARAEHQVDRCRRKRRSHGERQAAAAAAAPGAEDADLFKNELDAMRKELKKSKADANEPKEAIQEKARQIRNGSSDAMRTFIEVFYIDELRRE